MSDASTGTTMRYLVMAMRTPAFDPAQGAAHQAYLQHLCERGVLMLKGGFADGSGGAYVLEHVADMAEAQAIAAADPLQASGSSVLTVRAWNTR